MKKRLILTSIISIVLVVVLMIGSTYSIFVTSNVDEDLNVYKTGNLDVTYTLSEENVTFTSNLPVSEEDVIGIKPYRITVNNVGNVAYKFDLVLEDMTATDKIDYQYIMTKVGDLEAVNLSECEGNVIREGIVVPANDSAVIDVRVYLSEDVQNTEIGKSFYGKLSIEGNAVYAENDEIDNSALIAPSVIKVIFDANGGITTVESNDVIYGQTYGELPIPTRVGYTFSGWYTSLSGGTMITSSTIVSITSNQTLYAQWQENSN